jgi:Tol biopolymer transport system component
MLVSKHRILPSLVLLALAGSVAVPVGAAARTAPTPPSHPVANPSASSRPVALNSAARSSAPKVNIAALRGEGALAFTWGTSTYAASADHGTRLITKTAGTNLAWSHDGHWLAYIQTTTGPKVDASLWIAAAGGGSAHRVTELANVGSFTWSPTADTLAVSARLAGQAKAVPALWLVSPNKAPRKLVANAGGAAWSPDGRTVAMNITVPSSLFSAGSDSLATMAVKGGPITNHVTAQNSGIILSGWWPNGQGLIFMIDPGHSSSIAADGLTLYSISLHGNTKTLIKTLGYQDWLSWAPSGTKLLVVSGTGREIWTGKSLSVCDAAAGSCHVLSMPKGSVALDPAWSPNGKQVAYVRAKDAGKVGGFSKASTNEAWVRTRSLWIADPTGAHAHQLPAAGPGIYQPMWSRSGTALFYVRDNTLWRIGLTGASPTKVVGPFPTPPAAYPFGYYGHLSWSGQLALQGI